MGVVNDEFVEVTFAGNGDILPGVDHSVPIIPDIDCEDVRGSIRVLLLEPLDVGRGGALDPALQAGRVPGLDTRVAGA